MSRTDYQKAWREKNAEDVREKKRAYYLANQERAKARRAERSEANKAYMVEWRKKNADHCKEYDVKYKAENRDRLSERQKKYAASHKEESRARVRHRYAKDPGYFLFNQMNVRAKWFGVVRDLTRDQLDEIRARFGDVCPMCSKQAKLTLDHIVPLSKGGPHSATNIQFLCAPCNTRKGNRLPVEDERDAA